MTRYEKAEQRRTEFPWRRHISRTPIWSHARHKPQVRGLSNIANSDPPTVRVISDNKLYSPYERTANEILIVGRIRWFAREI